MPLIKMKKKTLLFVMTAMTIITMFAALAPLVKVQGTTGILGGWMRPQYDLARTRYFPIHQNITSLTSLSKRCGLLLMKGSICWLSRVT